jgi:transposase
LTEFLSEGCRLGARRIWRASAAKRPPARQLEDSLPVEGLVEVDESYFGGVRKGKRGRGAAGKIPVFGILKRGGKVHTMMIPDVRKDTLLPIIRHKVVPDSIVYTDSYPAYDVLDVSEFHRHRNLRTLKRWAKLKA